MDACAMNIHPEPLPGFAMALSYGVTGLLLGLFHFCLLHWNTRLYMAGKRGALVLHALRIGGVAIIFVLAARHGAWPLLLVLGGFHVGRTLILRRVRTA
jgi:F1F0 ATPase subunit 2